MFYPEGAFTGALSSGSNVEFADLEEDAIYVCVKDTISCTNRASVVMKGVAGCQVDR